MRSTYITASIIAVLFVLWLVSGQLSDDAAPPPSSVAEQNRQHALLMEEKPPMAVRVATLYAQPQSRQLTIRGTTQSKRVVTVRAQTNGTLAERLVERGDKVTAGQLLCRISTEDRVVALEEAKEALNQARIEYEGSQRLAKSGLQSETAIAQAKARLATAEANLKRSELALERLEIRAPFDGIVDDVTLELGDYVTPGAVCAQLVDLDPMLLVGQVAEKDVASLSVGDEATAELSSGIRVEGAVTFVGKTAQEATRTYPIEIQIENHDYSIPSGISARIHVPLETVSAHKISPALLALDDQGRLGVRTIDGSNRVTFYFVEVIRDDVDGIWVSGLPEVSTIITVGQELVVAGEVVEPIFETIDTSLPVLVEEPTTVVEAESS